MLWSSSSPRLSPHQLVNHRVDGGTVADAKKLAQVFGRQEQQARRHREHSLKVITSTNSGVIIVCHDDDFMHVTPANERHDVMHST